MGRRSRRRRDANTPSLAPLSSSWRSHNRRNDLAFELGDFEDRRTFHPEGNYRDARPLDNRFAINLITSHSTPVRKVSRTSFSFPQNVSVCVRRNQRREIILALGKGGGGHRPPRRNEQSEISCRRK